MDMFGRIFRKHYLESEITDVSRKWAIKSITTLEYWISHTRFWANQELTFEHNGKIAETGNPSFVDNVDDSIM